MVSALSEEICVISIDLILQMHMIRIDPSSPLVWRSVIRKWKSEGLRIQLEKSCEFSIPHEQENSGSVFGMRELAYLGKSVLGSNESGWTHSNLYNRCFSIAFFSYLPTPVTLTLIFSYPHLAAEQLNVFLLVCFQSPAAV